MWHQKTRILQVMPLVPSLFFKSFQSICWWQVSHFYVCRAVCLRLLSHSWSSDVRAHSLVKFNKTKLSETCFLLSWRKKNLKLRCQSMEIPIHNFHGKWKFRWFILRKNLAAFVKSSIPCVDVQDEISDLSNYRNMLSMLCISCLILNSNIFTTSNYKFMFIWLIVLIK